MLLYERNCEFQELCPATQVWMGYSWLSSGQTHTYLSWVIEPTRGGACRFRKSPNCSSRPPLTISLLLGSADRPYAYFSLHCTKSKENPRSIKCLTGVSDYYYHFLLLYLVADNAQPGQRVPTTAALRRVPYPVKSQPRANGKEKTRMTMGPSYVFPESNFPFPLP